jgi:hypothetical protein
MTMHFKASFCRSVWREQSGLWNALEVRKGLVGLGHRSDRCNMHQEGGLEIAVRLIPLLRH